MEFYVVFSNSNSETVVPFINSHPVGYNGVSKIRKHLGLPNLPLEVIGELSQTYYSSRALRMPIPENVAASNADRLINSNMIECDVTFNFFEKYLTQVVKCQKKEDGAVVSAWLEYSLDTQAILRDWIAAGCPQEWGWENDSQAAYEFFGANKK